jgi:hypothetical protein
MKPKRPKEIIKQVSEELDLPQGLVDDIITFYYKSIRKKLTDLEDLKYKLPGLGDFSVRKAGVTKLTNKFERMKNGLGSETFIDYHNIKLVDARLEKLYAIGKKINSYIEKKNQFKEEKYGK